jgi:tRNA pseudouridine32 synthase/23S rRNA pseudouridine746 synthase
MVFAIGIDAQRHLSKQFELRQTDKQYQALVLGALTGAGRIDVPVRYDPTRPPMHVADPEHPKHALTYWHALPSIQTARAGRHPGRTQASDRTLTPAAGAPVTRRPSHYW